MNITIYPTYWYIINTKQNTVIDVYKTKGDAEVTTKHIWKKIFRLVEDDISYISGQEIIDQNLPLSADMFCNEWGEKIQMFLNGKKFKRFPR